MYTFHKLTKNQYEKVVNEKNSVQDAIFLITDTNDIFVYNKGQLEINKNLSLLLTENPELNIFYNSFKEVNKNEVKDNQNKITQNIEKDFDLNKYMFDTNINQNINQKEINPKKKDEIFTKKYTFQKEAVKWFRDKSNSLDLNDESFSNKLGIQ